MWGYYGPDWDVNDSTYLAEIATRSREMAEKVFVHRWEQTEEMRGWIFNIIVAAVWQHHGNNCRCVLDQYHDPVVRVRGTSAAIRRLVNQWAEESEITPYEVFRAADESEIMQHLLHSPALADCLEDAAAHREIELRGRERARQNAIKEILRAP